MPGVGGGRHAGGDARDDLERDARRAQRLGLLAAAPEHERIAALEPHDHRARPRRARAAAARSPPGRPTGRRPPCRRRSAPRRRARTVERAGRDQAVVDDHVGARRSARARARSSGPGSPGPAPTRYTVMPALRRSASAEQLARARRRAAARRTRARPARAAGTAVAHPGGAVGRPTQALSSSLRRRSHGHGRRPGCRRRPRAHAPARARRRRRRSASGSRTAAEPQPARQLRARLERQAPWPAAGTSSSSSRSGLGARPRRPARRSRGPARRTRPRELAQAGVDVAAQRDDLQVRRSARSWAARRRLLVPTRAPGASACQRRAPQSASRGSAAPGIATSSSPAGELGGHILGRVHREVDASVEQRPLELRDPARLVLHGGAAVAGGGDR